MTRKKKFLVIGIPLLIVAAVGFKAYTGKDKKLPEVTTQKVKRSDLKSLVTATGKTEAQRKVDQTQRRATALSAEESLKALFFDRDAARATADEAKKNYERAQRSFSEQI